ncbi:hypothetical protein D3C75_1062120 [compost metagenome]
MGEDLQQDVPGQFIMLGHQEVLHRPLAYIPCSPSRSARLLQPVRHDEMGHGIMGIPPCGFVQDINPLLLGACNLQPEAGAEGFIEFTVLCCFRIEAVCSERQTLLIRKPSLHHQLEACGLRYRNR